jgi:hypothetical protein
VSCDSPSLSLSVVFAVLTQKQAFNMSKFAQGEILEVLKKKMRAMKDDLETAVEESEGRQALLNDEIQKREKVRFFYSNPFITSRFPALPVAQSQKSISCLIDSCSTLTICSKHQQLSALSPSQTTKHYRPYLTITFLINLMIKLTKRTFVRP